MVVVDTIVFMSKIIPHLWFDKEAKEAANFYTSLFPDSKITSTSILKNTPSGDTEIVSFNLKGMDFMAISAGPLFTFNPSVSFFLNFDPSIDPDARTNLDRVWEKLLDGGTVLMELQEYPFSKYYGWIQDRYGLSWQLILTNPQGEPRPFIVPSLLFVGDISGKANEAITFYLSVFNDSRLGSLNRYPTGMEPDTAGTIMYADFKLFDTWLAAMDSAHEHHFGFNESISFIVNCDSQEEIDYFWQKLSAVPESEQCGWLKDKFGISWQIVPTETQKLMNTKDQEMLNRITQAFLQMKKLDITKLKQAAAGS